MCWNKRRRPKGTENNNANSGVKRNDGAFDQEKREEEDEDGKASSDYGGESASAMRKFVHRRGEQQRSRIGWQVCGCESSASVDHTPHLGVGGSSGVCMRARGAGCLLGLAQGVACADAAGEAVDSGAGLYDW